MSKLTDDLRAEQIRDHVLVLRRMARSSQEDYALQRLENEMINGPVNVEIKGPICSTPGVGEQAREQAMQQLLQAYVNLAEDHKTSEVVIGIHGYYQCVVVPLLQDEILSLTSQLDILELREKELTEIGSLMTKHVNVVDPGDLVGSLRSHFEKCDNLIETVSDEMKLFCDECPYCGGKQPLLMDSYPNCIEDDDPSPGGNGPICERCRMEFFRLYDGGEPAKSNHPEQYELSVESKDHQHTILFCCLRVLVNEVMPYVSDILSIEKEQAEGAYELLFDHIEEAWDPSVVEGHLPCEDEPHPVGEIFDEIEAELSAQSHIDAADGGCRHE